MAGLCEGRVVIVTGAGGGIGRAHAKLFAAEGASVVVNDLGGSRSGEGSDVGAAQAVVNEIEAEGGKAVANTDNIATWDGAQAVVQQAIDTYGTLDVVVNNAGILRDVMFHKMDDDQWDAVLAVHLTGTKNVTAAAWPHMRSQGYGRVVTTTSATGLFGNVGQANYGAAKAGLYGLTRNLAVEGRKAGILVNAVSPMAATRMNADMLGDRADLLDPAMVAPVVAYLCSRDLTRTGQVLSAGGGHVAAVQVVVTPGITDPGLTAEAVRDRIEEIVDRTDAFAPRNIGEEIGPVLENLGAAKL